VYQGRGEKDTSRVDRKGKRERVECIIAEREKEREYDLSEGR
jgi:hypothetical protein